MRFLVPPFPSFMDWLKTLWLLVLMGAWVYVSERFLQPLGPLVLILPIPLTAFTHHILWGKSSRFRPIWFPGRVSWGIPMGYYAAAVFPILIILLFLALIVALIFGVVAALGHIGWINEDGAGIVGRLTGGLMRRILKEKSSIFDPILFVVWVYFAAQVFRFQRVNARKSEAENVPNKD